MKKVIFLLCMFIGLQTFAQHNWTEGTIYLQNGTAKKGLIKFPRVSKDLIAFNGKQKVRFKKNRKAKKEKYDYTQVDKIVFTPSETETEIYEYIPVSKKKYQLFKRIVNGDAMLYARSVSYTTATAYHPGTLQPILYNFNDFDEFYVWKKGEKIASPLITIRISRSFKKRAMEYFADCPSLVNKLEDRTYRKENIKEVVTIYNNCN